MCLQMWVSCGPYIQTDVLDTSTNPIDKTYSKECGMSWKTLQVFTFLVVPQDPNENLGVIPDSLNSLRLMYLVVEMDTNLDTSRFVSQCCSCIYKIDNVPLFSLDLVDTVKNYHTLGIQRQKRSAVSD